MKRSFHDKLVNFGLEYTNILTIILFSIMVGGILGLVWIAEALEKLVN
ncbi:hypothetical protein [Oceanobacillus sp. FSL H7-0719]